jgi:hypothetical protein
MTINIPNSVFSIYKEAADFFIDNENIGQTFSINYPAIPVAYSGPVSKPVGFNSNTVRANGQVGNPIDNEPTREVVTTDTIRLRVYWSKKDWIKISNLAIPDADAMIIGYLSTLPKLKRAESISLTKEESVWTFVLSGEPFPHGFGHDRYFIGYIKRA